MVVSAGGVINGRDGKPRCPWDGAGDTALGHDHEEVWARARPRLEADGTSAGPDRTAPPPRGVPILRAVWLYAGTGDAYSFGL